MDSNLVLAGGGHAHILLLKRWAMNPHLRPKGLITLVSNNSYTFYSGMLPGYFAGIYDQDEITIDLHRLAALAKVSLIIGKVTGIDAEKKIIYLDKRDAISYKILSLNIGGKTNDNESSMENMVTIRPLEGAIVAVNKYDSIKNSNGQIEIYGSGLSAIELALSLRNRWPRHSIILSVFFNKIHGSFKKTLAKNNVLLRNLQKADDIYTPKDADRQKSKLILFCTGTRGPNLLANSGLPVDNYGRVHTDETLQVIGQTKIFAVGDCAVIESKPRPPSGVWAVKAAIPLARNLEAACLDKKLRKWRPQAISLQLVGGFVKRNAPTAWALWGPYVLGPNPLFWHLKKYIDRKFIGDIQKLGLMPLGEESESTKATTMLCRGCAAKLPAAPLESALKKAGFQSLSNEPEDATPLPETNDLSGNDVLQSVDGFPALISDTWLNGRLTALHACSDLWASGAKVRSAQAVVTVPLTSSFLQEELLKQTLAGIRSVLDPQDAELIGGHTLESRTPPINPLSLGMQVVLTVQGSPTRRHWRKRGIKPGDQLLLSRYLGTGVLFAASMTGETFSKDLDFAIAQMSKSQHLLVEELQELDKSYPGQLHAATDITGFGLLGHLGEMLGSSNNEIPPVLVTLKASSIPALPGALKLLKAGYASSLAPANRRGWVLLDPPCQGRPAAVSIQLDNIEAGSKEHQALLELLIDPQTCGPLLISVAPPLAEVLLTKSPQTWWAIGTASHI